MMSSQSGIAVNKKFNATPLAFKDTMNSSFYSSSTSKTLLGKYCYASATNPVRRSKARMYDQLTTAASSAMNIFSRANA